MQRDQAHAAGGVAGVALGRHVGHDVGAVLDVGGLTEGGVGSAGIVVVAAQHDRTDLAVADHLVELQSQVHAAHSVGVQDPALGAHDHLVLAGVTDPDVVVVVLIAAGVRLDVLGGSRVGLGQVLGLPGQAAPTEGTVAEVEQGGTEDVFHIGGEYEAVQVVFTVLADLLSGHAGVVNGLQEGVAVVEEVGALLMELADHLIVMLQSLVNQLGEALGILIQHLGALLEGQALGAVAAVVSHVAGGLIAHQIHMDALLIQVLQQIHHVAVVGNRAGGLAVQVLLGDGQSFIQAVGAVGDPALGVAGGDAGIVHLGDDGGGAGDLSGLALGAAHAAQTGGDEQAAGQVAVLGNAQLQAASAQQGVEGAVHDALGTDVHPAAGGHLAVVGNAQSGGAVEVLLVVVHTDHQTGRQLMRVEQAQGVAGHDHQSLLIGHDLQILLDQAVLHPVLANLTGLTVGHQLIGVQSHIKVQVVVDHDLEGLGLGAVALVLLDGLAVQLAGGAETVAVNPAMLLQLLGKLLSHLLVVIRMDVTQSVLDGQSLVGLGQVGFPAGCAADSRFKSRVLRQLIVQLDGHSVVYGTTHCHSLIS